MLVLVDFDFLSLPGLIPNDIDAAEDRGVHALKVNP